MSESFEIFYHNNLRILEEIYIKTLDEDEWLMEGNLRCLLVEKLEQEDIENLRAQALDLKKFLDKAVSVTGQVPGLAPANDWFKKQSEEVGKAAALAAKLDLQNPKGAMGFIKKMFGDKRDVNKTLQSLAFTQQQSAEGLAAFGGTLERLARNLEGQDIPSDAAFSSLPADGKITPKDIQAGIEKSFGEVGKGFFGKAVDGFLKMIGKRPKNTPDFPFKEVAASFMDLNLDQLKNLAKELPTSALPKVEGDALKDIASGEEPESSGEDSGGESRLSDKDVVAKSARKWMKTLQDDGANKSLLAIGEKWMEKLARDVEFMETTVAKGLRHGDSVDESVNTLSFLLHEQVEWTDIVKAFSRNKPKEIANLNDKNIAPIVAPFAQALADYGVDVVGKDGKPIKFSDEDLEDELDDIEDDLPEDVVDDEATGGEDKLGALRDILKNSELVGDVEEILKKIAALFDLESEQEQSPEENVAESKLIWMLQEKTVPYDDVVDTLKPHLPEEEQEALSAIQSLSTDIKTEFGEEYGVADIPESPGADAEDDELPADDPDAELTPEQRAEDDAVGEQLADQIGSGPIGKSELAAILKKFPDIVGQGQKATRARRKLRKAINTAAGKEVFEEALDLAWPSKDKYALNESSDYDAIARWRKLAGIK
jgi:hypothetical protein